MEELQRDLFAKSAGVDRKLYALIILYGVSNYFL